MLNYTKKNISNFLAFMVGPKADYISIDYLNSIDIKKSNNSFEDLKKEILKIFNSEIKSYKITDGDNIGLLLSGGLDSTLLLKLLKNNFPKSNIYTYTLGYKESDPHLSISRNISKKYNTIHKEVIYDIKNNLFEIFDDIYSSGYELEGEDSLIMNHILSKEVKKDCNIVFSGFGLDYIFAGMDLFRNSFMEKLYNMGKIDKKYILEALRGNKYYLKYVLDKIDSDLGEDFFIKYGEYYGNILNENLEDEVQKYFFNKVSEIRPDISNLKKQIYFIIFTSLSNRYNPYNKPYELQGIKHYNSFGSKNIIKQIISLNIPDNYLYDSSTQEKKFIIKSISRDIIEKNILDNLHVGTVLKYESAIKNNKNIILKLIKEHNNLLLKYLKKDYFSILSNNIDDSIWYEKSKQIIILLQFIFYIKYNKKNKLGL